MPIILTIDTIHPHTNTIHLWLKPGHFTYFTLTYNQVQYDAWGVVPIISIYVLYIEHSSIALIFLLTVTIHASLKNLASLARVIGLENVLTLGVP